MNYYTVPGGISDTDFISRMADVKIREQIDGMHIITLLFQSARSKKLAKNTLPIRFMIEKLRVWDIEWSERDMSTFVYGIRALECIDPIDGELLKLGASKIASSKAVLSSRAIGNALYGLQGITSDSTGATELCAALAVKIEQSNGDLNGQDIGIGMYGLQGMSPDEPEVRLLLKAFADKIVKSETELDAQALSNALYGMQSMNSDYNEVLELVSAVAAKVSESRPVLCAQAIGSALYGLQKLSSESLQVRSLIAAITEKISSSSTNLDAQAIGNALFGLQRMKSNSAEVRALLTAITTKMSENEKVEMDSKGIGSALYGLQSMSSNVPQVRILLSSLANRIKISQCSLSGNSIGDALYGLSAMASDCPELRALLTALAGRIDSNIGKLDSQDIGNALFGLQGLSSEMAEVRVIVTKLAEKIKRSKAILRSQHIGRACYGLQRLGADSKEVKFLLKQLAKRIQESDRTRMTSAAIADTVYGLQGLSSSVEEVQVLVGEIAKKVASTAAEFSPAQVGRTLFGMQGLSSSASIFQESAIGLDADEVQFLLSALWDKIKVMKQQFPLSAISMGLSGLTYLKDPIADNIRQFLYLQIVAIGEKRATDVNAGMIEEIGKPIVSYQYDSHVFDVSLPMSDDSTTSSKNPYTFEPTEIISTVRALRLNNLLVPKWLALLYNELEGVHHITPTIQQSRSDKITVQRYMALHKNENVIPNGIVDGFRLDLCFPDIKLNIELDGLSHKYPARARYDRARDEYISVKKNYKVSRIKIFGKSVDELIVEIERAVKVRTDSFADSNIQLLYAKDTEIRKLYQDKK